MTSRLSRLLSGNLKKKRRAKSAIEGRAWVVGVWMFPDASERAAMAAARDALAPAAAAAAEDASAGAPPCIHSTN